MLRRAVLSHRVEVQQHDEHPRPFDVAQEPMAQPRPLGGAFDQPGNVGHDELGAVAHPAQADHAQVGLERGERVVGDFGLGRGDDGNEGRLPGIGKAHQGHVGHELELHVQPTLLALLSLLGEGRGPAPVGQEPCIAPSPLPTCGNEKAIAVMRQVALHGAVGIAHDGADGDGDDDVLAPGAVALLARTVHTVGGPPMGMVTKAQQRGLVHRRRQPHVTSMASVTAVRTAPIHVRLASP